MNKLNIALKGAALCALLSWFCMAVATPKNTTPTPKKVVDPYAQYDPLEPINRVTFAVERKVGDYFLVPLSAIYTTIVRNPVRPHFESFLHNLGEPLTAFNALFQGRGEDAAGSLFRLMINSTVGLLGTFDVASKLGVPPANANFTQTVALYIPYRGPYIIWRSGASDLRSVFADIASFSFQLNGRINTTAYSSEGANIYGNYTTPQSLASAGDAYQNSLKFLTPGADAYALLRQNYYATTSKKTLRVESDPFADGL